jgi:hypothetical protein
MIVIHTTEQLEQARLALEQRRPQVLAPFILTLIHEPNGIGPCIHKGRGLERGDRNRDGRDRLSSERRARLRGTRTLDPGRCRPTWKWKSTLFIFHFHGADARFHRSSCGSRTPRRDHSKEVRVFHRRQRPLRLNPEEIVNENPFYQHKTARQTGCQIDYLIQTKLDTLYVCEIEFSRNEIISAVIPEIRAKIGALSRPRGMSCRPVLIHVNGVNEEVTDSDYFAHIVDMGELLN